MKKSMLIKKTMAICITTLFFTIISTSAIGIKNQSSPLNTSLYTPPMPQVEGTLGDNSWYISDVYISFLFDPKLVQEIGYFINGGWHEYTGDPFLVSGEGEYLIPWYWIDEDGIRHDMFPIAFQIDKTPPTIQITKFIETNFSITFNTTCSDSISDIEFVEFYLDDELVLTVSDEPYTYLYKGSGKHLVYAIAYNFAGLTEQSETLDTTPRSRSYNFPLFNMLLQRLSNIILLIQQIYLR